MGTLESSVEYDVKKHLYLQKFMEFVNKRAHRITFLGLGRLGDKKVDIREEYAKFLKHSKLDATNEELNADIIDTVKNALKDQKFEMTYDKLYHSATRSYDDSINRLVNHLEKRPYMLKSIYSKYFPSKVKNQGMEL